MDRFTGFKPNSRRRTGYRDARRRRHLNWPGSSSSHRNLETRKDLFDQQAPRTYLTAFGWCIGGPGDQLDNGTSNFFSFQQSKAERNCDFMLQQFVEAET
jgi:hypothetical protein